MINSCTGIDLDTIIARIDVARNGDRAGRAAICDGSRTGCCIGTPQMTISSHRQKQGEEHERKTMPRFLVALNLQKPNPCCAPFEALLPNQALWREIN